MAKHFRISDTHNNIATDLGMFKARLAKLLDSSIKITENNGKEITGENLAKACAPMLFGEVQYHLSEMCLDKKIDELTDAWCMEQARTMTEEINELGMTVREFVNQAEAAGMLFKLRKFMKRLRS